MRQASAIDMSVPAGELEGSDVKLEDLAELANALVEQVSAVKEHYEHLQRTLDEPVRALEEPVRPLEEPVPAVAPLLGGTRPVKVVHEEEAEPEGSEVHDSARLVVMDMAMSGSTREETKTYLREALRLEGGDPIVDEVFDRTEAAQESPPLHRRLFSRNRD